MRTENTSIYDYPVVMDILTHSKDSIIHYDENLLNECKKWREYFKGFAITEKRAIEIVHSVEGCEWYKDGTWQELEVQMPMSNAGDITYHTIKQPYHYIDKKGVWKIAVYDWESGGLVRETIYDNEQWYWFNPDLDLYDTFPPINTPITITFPSSTIEFADLLDMVSGVVYTEGTEAEK